ncbi:hypothetical protein RN001_007419 [Aquatica leii]|uniref:Tektin n=1 Tax=Aquatica leii TaxID=1421715 RepID=A0AAN7QIA8_9COLE|nr:hypothetical protein RN001_007419 [Aquatica leii]
MSEQPPRSCGAGAKGQYQKVDDNTDYLQKNTTPKPELAYQNRSALNETHLGVSQNSNPPDLTVSPNKAQVAQTAAAKPEGAQGTTKKCCLKSQNESNAKENQPSKGILKQTGMSGAIPPGDQNPNAEPPVPNALRPVPPSDAPCYMPQPEDQLPEHKEGGMEPIGPWATGRVDWSPMAGITGTRPVVDKYSITRYSEGEWRRHNEEILNRTREVQHKANLVDWNGYRCCEQTRADIDKNQEDNTRRLTQRAQDVHRWKCELEMAIAAATEELNLLETERTRLKSAAAVLMIPESICGECLERRTGRLDPDLVRDEVEEELIKEMALISEIRETFGRTLRDLEKQLLENKTAKQKLEYDWSDKSVAHDIEFVNCALSNKSTVMMFKPGSTIFPNEQSSSDHWEHFTRETLQEGEATRQRSIVLRGTLEAIFINSARDLRSQADRVDLALSKHVACLDELRITLENELLKVLQKLADVEKLVITTRDSIRRLDTSMKLAQTRLDNRLQRPRVENCRDDPHYGLIEEAKTIGESIAALNSLFKTSEKTQSDLNKVRIDLEREIMLKRKALEIDRSRIQTIRSHYPSVTALTGH